jgi:crotonobetainyl-CoA:carnitine CoA-transferase CaiB-like acyl-CoA transferase
VTEPAQGPLAGLIVFDLTRVMAGPHCGKMLADLGADVIKVEPPDGDITRFAVPRVNSLSVYFIQQNAGKRNVSVDLRDPRGSDLFRRLAAHADMVIENYRPGVADRLGVGYDALRAVNPGIIYGTITGFGQGNAWAGRRAYARMVQAEVGMLLTDAQGERPSAHTAFSHGDIYPALELTVGLLAALQVRGATGLGQRVDVAMGQTLLYINEYAAIDAIGEDVDEDLGTVGRGTDPIFQLKDGRTITIIGNPTTAGRFESYCDLIGGGLLDDSRFATYELRRQNRLQLLKIIQEWIYTLDTPEALQAALATKQIVMGVAQTTLQAIDSDWAQATGAMTEVSDRAAASVRVPSPPWQFSTSVAAIRGVAAYRGEHNREVLRELLAMPDPEIEALEGDGVLSARLPRTE